MSIARARLLSALVLIVASGCAGVAPPTSRPSASPAANSTNQPSASPGATLPPGATPGATLSPGATPAGATFDQPWAVATLTDVTTGGQFRVADLAAEGKVVFVETMAIWCSNCLSQQQAATTALSQLDPARVAWVAIDVETSEDAAALARYREQHGFPFQYVISSPDLSRALAADFGDVVLSPPSVNVIVLGTDGQVTYLLGHHSAADIVAIAGEHGA